MLLKQLIHTAAIFVTLLSYMDLVCGINKARGESISTNKQVEQIFFKYREANGCDCNLDPCLCGEGTYLRSLTNRIFSHWNPPLSHHEKIVVEFKILLNGGVSNLRVVSGEDPTSNQSAISAIENSAPFYALPESAKEPVDLRFDFPQKKDTLISGNEGVKKIDEKIKTYLYLVQRTIRNSWSMVESSLGKEKAVVSFDFDKNGTISNCRLVEKSDSKSFNELTVKTILTLSPISIAPGLKKKVRCQFTFDSNLKRCFLSKVTYQK